MSLQSNDALERRCRYDFASDTVAPACPEVWAAVTEAHMAGYVGSYGADPFTERAETLVRELFGRPCSVYFVTSGTAANAIALSLLAAPYDAVVCHPFAHVELDEANAPEFFTGGAKLVHAGGADAKIDPATLPAVIERGHGFHAPSVRAVTITQATELGSVYSLGELAELRCVRARYPHLALHMDGARLGNAVAALGCPVSEITEGIDVLSFGGSKGGGGPCEAIVCFEDGVREPLTRDVVLRRLKRAGQVTAKLRYVSAAWIGLLTGELWLENSKNANTRARQLASGLEALDLELALPVETNQVFVRLPSAIVDPLSEMGWKFYYFDTISAHRFVCNWSTTERAVEELLADVRRITRGV